MLLWRECESIKRKDRVAIEFSCFYHLLWVKIDKKRINGEIKLIKIQDREGDRDADNNGKAEEEMEMMEQIQRSQKEQKKGQIMQLPL